MSNIKSSKLISFIKNNTQRNKSLIRNLKYKIRIIGGETPNCYYGCKFESEISGLSLFKLSELKYNILLEIFNLQEEVYMVGKTILFIRGDKWRI